MLAHGDPPFAAEDRPHRVRIADAHERPAVVGVLAQEAFEQELVGQVAPLALRQLLADPPCGERGLVVADVLGLAHQMVDQPSAAVAARQPVGRRERLLGGLGGVGGLDRAGAEVALAAGLDTLFAEVPAHGRRPAAGPVQ